jgi:hypothetical protein
MKPMWTKSVLNRFQNFLNRFFSPTRKDHILSAMGYVEDKREILKKSKKKLPQKPWNFLHLRQLIGCAFIKKITKLWKYHFKVFIDIMSNPSCTSHFAHCIAFFEELTLHALNRISLRKLLYKLSDCLEKFLLLLLLKTSKITPVSKTIDA